MVGLCHPQGLILCSLCKAYSNSVGVDGSAGQYCTSYFQSELDQIVLQRQILVGIMCKGLIFEFPLAMQFKEILDFQIVLLNLFVLVLVLYLHLQVKRNCFQYK